MCASIKRQCCSALVGIGSGYFDAVRLQAHDVWLTTPHATRSQLDREAAAAMAQRAARFVQDWRTRLETGFDDWLLASPAPADARPVLSERLAAFALHDNPDAAASTLEKDRHRFNHAPLVIAVVAAQGPDEKIPASERFSTASCVCFSLLQAAQAEGFGAQWLTGWPAYDARVHRLLGLAEDEAIAGFIHVGTPRLDAPERDRPDPLALLSDLAL